MPGEQALKLALSSEQGGKTLPGGGLRVRVLAQVRPGLLAFEYRGFTGISRSGPGFAAGSQVRPKGRPGEADFFAQNGKSGTLRPDGGPLFEIFVLLRFTTRHNRISARRNLCGKTGFLQPDPSAKT